MSLSLALMALGLLVSFVRVIVEQEDSENRRLHIRRNRILKVRDHWYQFRLIYERVSIILNFKYLLMRVHFFSVNWIFSVPSSQIIFFILRYWKLISYRKIKNWSCDVSSMRLWRSKGFWSWVFIVNNSSVWCSTFIWYHITYDLAKDDISSSWVGPRVYRKQVM